MKGIERIDDINNTDRISDSALVRQACALERGLTAEMNDRTWLKYRKICGVPSNAKRLTDREVVLLLVCASLHKAGWRKVSKLQVMGEANRRVRECGQQLLDHVQKFCGSSATVIGKDLPKVIEQTRGRKVSEKTLYRWGYQKGMPRFKRYQEYTPHQVKRWLQCA